MKVTIMTVLLNLFIFGTLILSVIFFPDRALPAVEPASLYIYSDNEIGELEEAIDDEKSPLPHPSVEVLSIEVLKQLLELYEETPAGLPVIGD